MRVAVSGTHNTGKSTLIAAFLAERPQYAHEPQAYEAILGSHVPGVRAAMHNLDLIVLVPLARNGPIPPRPDEDERFRRRVDEQLRRAHRRRVPPLR
jgi:hypothetical protein